MKILVVNGSPRGASGNTEVLVEAFLEGAHEAGAQTETVYLKDKKIEHCVGCFACWTKTPGVCIHKDDMPEILQKVIEADVLVCATPLYVYTVTGIMKDFMDRIIPSAQPFIEVKDGLCSHPPRYEGKKSIVLISNCGFPEQAHFSGLKATFKQWFRSDTKSLAGMICCAGGGMLRSPGLIEGFTWYIDAVKQAGREVVQNRKLSDETQSTLDRPLMEDQELFASMLNAMWRNMGLTPIGEGEVEAAWVDSVAYTGTILPPPTSTDTVRDLVSGMAASFNPTAAGNLRSVVQFVVTGEEPGQYFLNIADGKCTAYAGAHPSPTTTITTPAGIWLSIARGELDGSTAFISGLYKITGDMGVAMRFQELFPQAG